MIVSRRHPEWIKVKAPHGEAFFDTKRVIVLAVNNCSIHNPSAFFFIF